MRQQFKKKLYDMIGGTYEHKGKEVEITDFSVIGDDLIIKTNGLSYSDSVDNADKFIDTFKPVKTKKEKIAEEVKDEETTDLVTFTESQSIVQGCKDALPDLKDIILQNIENIKKDKGFIPQATAINSSIDTLLNMARFELKVRGIK